MTNKLKLWIYRLIEKAETMNLGMFIIKNGKVVNLSNDTTYKISEFVDMMFNEMLYWTDEDISITEPFKRKTLLKKGLTAEEQSIIEDLNFNELEIEIRHSRHYPLGEQIAPLVGFYGKDRAQEGLEKSYDSILSGKTGKQNKRVTLMTNAIPNVKILTIKGEVSTN